MEVAKEAAQLEAAGRSVIHLSIGEPDFTAPEPVQAAARRAIERGVTQYTPALGIAPLREAIAAWYRRAYGLHVDPGRVIVTAGASGALLLACAALVERDSEVLLPDPSYPCNRHFIRLFEGRDRLIPCGADARFQLTCEAVEREWSPATRGVLLASPSNPTGTAIRRGELAALIGAVRRRGGFVVVDEIYQGLSYDEAPVPALALDADAIVLNSFSKYFCMTGWRLGWMVVPQALVNTIEKLAQNLYICPSAVAQHAALACFGQDALATYEQRRQQFRRRRDLLVPALQRLGFGVPVVPDGAFYVYADIRAFGIDSWRFVFDVLQATGVCLVPGRDFGQADPDRWVRVSYATDIDRIAEALRRLEDFLRPRRATTAS